MPSEVRRLKQLDEVNRRLRKLVEEVRRFYLSRALFLGFVGLRNRSGEGFLSRNWRRE